MQILQTNGFPDTIVKLSNLLLQLLLNVCALVFEGRLFVGFGSTRQCANEGLFLYVNRGNR